MSNSTNSTNLNGSETSNRRRRLNETDEENHNKYTLWSQHDHSTMALQSHLITVWLGFLLNKIDIK